MTDENRGCVRLLFALILGVTVAYFIYWIGRCAIGLTSQASGLDMSLDGFFLGEWPPRLRLFVNDVPRDHAFSDSTFGMAYWCASVMLGYFAGAAFFTKRRDAKISAEGRILFVAFLGCFVAYCFADGLLFVAVFRTIPSKFTVVLFRVTRLAIIAAEWFYATQWYRGRVSELPRPYI